MIHSRTVDLQKLKIFLEKHCMYSKVIQLRDLHFIQIHRETLTIIGYGSDILPANTQLSTFTDIYQMR